MLGQNVAGFLASHDIFVRAAGHLEDFMRRPRAGEDSPVFQFMHALVDCGKPVVAAVTGAAIGIGTTLLLHCDLIYAGQSARFHMPFTALGLCPEGASSHLLAQYVGPRRANEWLLLSQAFSAEQAMEDGLLTELTDHGNSLEAARA